MKLEIKDVAKIKEASIELNGITVIAGENNTGKSTVGKILFAIFNSLNNMDKKIIQEKKNEYYHVFNRLYRNHVIHNEIGVSEYRRRQNIISRKFLNKASDYLTDTNIDIEILENDLKEILYKLDNNSKGDNDSEFIDECLSKLKALNEVSDKKVMLEVINRWFNTTFEGQVSPLTSFDSESYINLNIKNKELNINFYKNSCVEWNSEFNILHHAFYIDNPFVVDYMNWDSYLRSQFKYTDAYLLNCLNKKEEDVYDNAFEGVFDTVLVKDKLNEINNMLSNIIGGEFIENNDGEVCLKLNDFVEPLNIRNLSTGLKSFALIIRLLETGCIKERDVIILDEPEIHLHPEWQLVYAELIVLLQKQFDLTLVITTHSPYFLDAIDVFTTKYNLQDRVNFYLSENKGAVSYLKDVTQNIDTIYKKLSDPMQKLENIRNQQ